MIIKISMANTLATPLWTGQFAEQTPPRPFFSSIQVIFKISKVTHPITTLGFITASHLQRANLALNPPIYDGSEILVAEGTSHSPRKQVLKTRFAEVLSATRGEMGLTEKFQTHTTDIFVR